MRLRSDGLGKTELEAEITDIKKVDDLIIFCADTTKPVKWRLRMGFQEQDLRGLVLSALKPGNLFFIFNSLILSAFDGLFCSLKEIPGEDKSLKKEAK
jgi:hypothetical protein